MDQDLEKQNENVRTLKIPIETKYEFKSYSRKWYILIAYICYACLNNMQWIEYSSITHVLCKYYNVTTSTVNWSASIFLAIYPIVMIPGCYIIHKMGLRAAGLIGCIGTFLGTLVKIFSVKRDRFWMILLGQAMISTSQLVIISLPPKIASTWFGANEVSTACSLGVFGLQLGVALAYILPTRIVGDTDNVELIEHQLKTLNWVLVGSLVPVTAAVICYFPKKPPSPPSKAQAIQIREHQEQYSTRIFMSSVKKLFCNRGFVIHIVAFSINMAVFCAVSPLLPQLILEYFPGAYEEAGSMGFLMTVTGMIGSILFGVLLDKTHKYKEIILFVYLSAALSILLLMYTLKHQLRVMTYVSCAIFGIFTTAYLPIGFEIATELTYPVEEAMSSGIVFAISQVVGLLFSVGLSEFNQHFGAFWSLSSQAMALFVGTIITWLVPNDMRRLKASYQKDFQENASKLLS